MILTGMIVNDRALSKIHSYLKNEKRPFASKWCNIVGRWCLDYFSKYEVSPKKSIQTLFRDFAQSAKDEDTVGLVETFLGSLSEDYKALSKEINVDHLADSAARFFNKVRMERLVAAVGTELENQEVDEAQERLSSFSFISPVSSAMVDVFSDEDAWNEAIELITTESLIEYPNGLGEFFSHHLCRDAFISFLAPEKRGKSFWLIDAAWRASVLNKRKTLFYSVGDMSQRQMMRRFITRAARRPLSIKEIAYPKNLKIDHEGIAQVKTIPRNWDGPITKQEMADARAKIKMVSASSRSLLKMRCTPIDTTTVQDIRADIDQLVLDGWVPDVIVIDYADILAPEPGADKEFRHQTNATWKALRKLSQDYHACVITGTQSDAASYEAKVIRRKHFSEDKRKFSHVTGCVGINQTEEEKEKGVCRLNWVLLREGAYSESRCVTCAGSLELANPGMLSIW